MERDCCGFAEAVETLCEFYNIDISKDQGYTRRKSEAESNEALCRKYQKSLPVIHDYLVKRGFTKETISLYRFGWSEGAQALTIPLINRWNQVVGFTARYFNKEPKYKHTKNSVDSDLFIKRKFWFNLVNAQKLVRKHKRIWVVEGHLDAASIQQQGEAAIAYLGIVMSKEQLLSLRKSFEHFGNVEIIIVPDADGKAVKHIPKIRNMFAKWWPECNLRVALMESFGGNIKDANDMLQAGLQIADVKTQHIDVYTCRYLMTTCTNVEQEYAESQKFIKTVKSELVKVDIAKALAARWNQDIEDVKKHLTVSIDSVDEKLKDFADVYNCLSTLDEVLGEEEIGIGYPKIDSNVTFRKKWVVILGAYSFSGKTNLLIEWMLHWVVRLHKRVLFFSLEMPKEDVIEIIIGKIMKLPPYRIKETIVSPNGSQMYQKVADTIQKYLYVIDKNSLSIDDIEEYIKIANVNVFDEPVDIVCVDYYQYLKGTTEYSDDSKTARKMKEIAKNNNITLVMLSQFNKQSQYSDKGKFREPTQNDLKGAGDIGASADVIYLIWRPALMGNITEIEQEQQKYLTRLKVAKARKGLKHGVSHFELVYNKDTGCIEEK